MHALGTTSKRGAKVGQWAVRLSTGFALAWLAVASAMILADQIRQLPPRPPTPAERAAATPGAQVLWRTVSRRLAQRLPYHPAEFGAVWASRSGRLCGVATRLNAGVYYRERFFTDGRTTYFSSDDERRFLRAWTDCVGDHWVILKDDSDATGFCAVPRNQRSVIAAVICRKP